MIFGLVFALIIAAPLQDNSTESQVTMQQQAHDAYERHRQAAIRINDLAARIHSQTDADAMISEIADLFNKELPPVWAMSIIRQRVAHAEFEAASNPAKLIPEQRVVDVWNQYAREISAGRSHRLRCRDSQHARCTVHDGPDDVGSWESDGLDDAQRVRVRDRRQSRRRLPSPRRHPRNP